MKIRLLLVTCLIAVKSLCFAQNVITQDSLQTAGKNLENAKKPVIPSGRTILADMKTNNPAMYSQYRSGKKMQTTGIIMSGVSGGLIVTGAVFSILPDVEAGEATISIFGIKIQCRLIKPRCSTSLNSFSVHFNTLPIHSGCSPSDFRFCHK